MKLTVVTISYNVKYFLEQCLNSLEQAAKGIEHEVIVVDNASDDGSTEYITARFPKVKWIASDINHVVLSQPVQPAPDNSIISS